MKWNRRRNSVVLLCVRLDCVLRIDKYFFEQWTFGATSLEAKSFQLCAMCFTKLLLFGIDWCILPRDCASFLLSAMRDTNSSLTTHRWGASLKAALHSRCAMSDTKSLHKPLIHTSSPPIIILGIHFEGLNSAGTAS